jgi:hypothetical protein
MKIIIISIILVFVSIFAYADELFTNSKIEDLRFYDADKTLQSVWVIDKNGEKSEVYIGDSIGVEGQTVVLIEDGYIEVKKDNTVSRIRAIKKMDVQIDDSKAGPL